MILEILFLLVLLLADGDADSRWQECRCDCTCGRRYHLPSEYELGDRIPATTSASARQHQEVRPDRAKDIWKQEQTYGWDESSEDSHRPSDGSKRDYTGRPMPPHLERSAPDRKSPYLATVKKKKDKTEVWCKPCSKPFGSTMALHQHQAVIHSPVSSSVKPPQRATTPDTESAFVCEVCHQEFAHNYAVRSHKSQEHPWSILCSGCLVTFNDARDARDHYELVHGSSPINYRRTQSMLDHLKGTGSRPGSGGTTGNLAAWGLGPVSFDPQPVQEAVLKHHFVKTYRSHTVSSNYECNECRMVFQSPDELALHKADPLVHGGASLSSDDFPPLVAPVPVPDDTELESASPADPAHGPTFEVPTASWPMPAFSPESRSTESLSITPEARLTPEPSSASSVGTIGIALGPDEETEGPEIADDMVTPLQKADRMLEGSVTLSPTEYSGEERDLALAASPWTEIEDHDVDVDRTDSTIDATTVRPLEKDNEMSPTTTSVPSTIVLEETVEHIADASQLKVGSASSIHAIGNLLPPVEGDSRQLHVTTPYARAALASAHRISVWPLPGEHGVSEDVQDSTGEVAGVEQTYTPVEYEGTRPRPAPIPRTIGGIDCMIPSFAMTFSPSMSSAPLSLLSTPDADAADAADDVTFPIDRSGITAGSAPLTLNAQVALSQEVAAGPETWSAPQEAYEYTLSSRQVPKYSLDLASTSNGNRPQPRARDMATKVHQTILNQQGMMALDKYEKTDQYRGGKPKAAPAHAQYAKDKVKVKAKTKTKANVNAPLQPMYESEWQSITPSSSSSRTPAHAYTGARGGRAKVQSGWGDAPTEYQAGQEEDYGGW